MANNIPEMAYNRKMMAKRMRGGMAKAAKRKMMMDEKEKSSKY